MEEKNESVVITSFSDVITESSQKTKDRDLEKHESDNPAFQVKNKRFVKNNFLQLNIIFHVILITLALIFFYFL